MTSPPASISSKPSIVIAVLHWKGRSNLEALLPTLQEAISSVDNRCSALLLHNDPADTGTRYWLTEKFPWMGYVQAERNDFLYSYNALAERLREDIIIFLNDDLRVSDNFVNKLLPHFTDEKVFAVSATARDWDDRYFTSGPARLVSHHGIYYSDFDRERQELSHTLFCPGGFTAVDRRKFNSLGGFNRLFWPAYGEDLDLCFRAWRKGWRCIFEPGSIVYHRESGSFEQMGADRPTRLMLRSQFLFQWSSLPMIAPWYERGAAQLLLAWRHWNKGDGNWGKTWAATWLEWQRVRKNFQWMKTSKAEVEEIRRRIDLPVLTK